ncbi:MULTISPECIES: abortive infection system antitoxin AbiGi family protein [Lentibacillus]|uniref:abortive infection system antitoxin AbiGi family protein n=1 Tax=Lentibacillus TaxID=175304 RepID=UPI0002626FF9|nr:MULTISPECIES: abortive infection system antitoxin AbiGi family protein [Lentibacillus]
MRDYYSNIYWHFTGGPKVDWEFVSSPKDLWNQPTKSSQESFNILTSILSSKKLIGNSTEKVSSTESTEKFCCVCDIPLKYLDNHKRYYGDVAIGFRAKSIHPKFNPVLYIDIENAPLIFSDRKIDPDKTFNENSPAGEFLDYILGLDKESLGSLSSFIKNTKFSESDEESFYGEREWRCLGDFHFKEDDVEVIILPDRFKSDLENFLAENGLNLNWVTILSWELIYKL